MIVKQAQGPTRRTCGGLGAGKLGDAGLDLAGDPDFTGRFVPDFGNQRAKRAKADPEVLPGWG